MSGPWLPPKAKPHRCDRPEIGFDVAVGDRWECDCGAVYVVVMESQHGESWKQWRREAPDER